MRSAAPICLILLALSSPAAPAATWNPDGSILNHYELTTDMKEQIGSDFIFITKSNNIESIAARFNSAETITTIHIPVHRDYSLDFYAYRLNGFKGY